MEHLAIAGKAVRGRGSGAGRRWRGLGASYGNHSAAVVWCLHALAARAQWALAEAEGAA